MGGRTATSRKWKAILADLYKDFLRTAIDAMRRGYFRSGSKFVF